MAALDAIRSVTRTGGEVYVGTMLIDEFVQLPSGGVTTLAELNPILETIPLWQAYPEGTLNGDYTNCTAPNRRGLEVALQESQFRVDDSRIVSMGGYVRATAILDPLVAKYQALDARLERTPFDPQIPYFLDEPGSVHAITGKHGASAAPESPPAQRPSWWRRLRR
jgi:hypothetical protein